MRFLLFYILIIAAILLVMCLPFLPARFRFSLASCSYSGKNRWQNISFVIETIFVGSVLLAVAPYIKNFFDWVFELRFFKWLIDLFPDRFVYAIDVFVIVITNIVICMIFMIVKRTLRSFLDKKVFKLSSNPSADKKKKNKKKNSKKRSPGSADTRKDGSDGKRDSSEKRLNLLRRNSVLVFDEAAKKNRKGKVVVSDYTHEALSEPAADEREQPEIKHTENLSVRDMIREYWFKFIGLFYRKEEDYEYVKTGTYRWAKELKWFVFFVACLYLLVCIVIFLPVFISFSDFPGFYSVARWLVNNTYMYPILSIVLLFEVLWFLDGEYKESEEPEAPFVSFVDNMHETKSVDLARSKDRFLEKYDQRFNIKNFSTAPLKTQSAYIIEDKKTAIQNIAKAVKAKKGFVNGDYMQSIEYMLDGEHVLFDAPLYSSLGEYIVHYLFVTLSFGTRALFICKDQKEIDDAASYLETNFRNLTRIPRNLWRISTYEKMHEGTTPDILLLTPEQFLEENLYVDGKAFFKDLVDVFVLDADKILTANNYYCLILAKKLEKATTQYADGHSFDADSSLAVQKRIRYKFFSSGHIQSLGNSIRQFFNLENAPLETFHSFGLASKNEVFVWRPGMSSTLYVDSGANQVALEVQIARDACSDGITDINLISETAVYSSQVNEIPGLSINRCDISDNPIGYVIVADDCFNLPNSIYNFSRFAGREASVLHVVSKPYLLRDYFTSKAEGYVSQFELIGKTMSEHADPAKASIIVLLCDAVNGIERSLFIKRAVDLLGDRLPDNLKNRGADNTDNELYLQECVKLCYSVAFDVENDYEPKYSLKREQDSELSYKTFVYLKDSEQLFKKLLDSTKTVKLEYVNTQGVEYIPVFKDEITQHFIPGQVYVHNNRGYTIKDMNVEQGILLLDDTVPSVNVPMDYIQTRLYDVTACREINSFGHDYRTKNSVISHIGFTVYDADITVNTTGYYSIEKAVQTVDLVKPNFAKYVNLNGDHKMLDKIKRELNTKMLVVELETYPEDNIRAAYLLSVILHEFMKTLFPHMYRCVSVCPILDPEREEEFFNEEPAIRDLYPRLVGSFTKGIFENVDAEHVNNLRFAIIEDIQNGNGIVETLVDGNGITVTNLLHVAADFLDWILNVSTDEFKYLNFGYDELPAVFDIQRLEVLIRQFRHDVERTDTVKRTNEADSCFFCHRTLDTDEGIVLDDGRRICHQCFDSSVDTFDELDKCLKEVLDSVINSTSVKDTFPPDISVDFVSTAELRERYGENSQRLPIAYCNHMTKCIYVEYGLPRVSVCGSIARKITELWQDINIVNDGSAIYDGHPDHVEIQVLTQLKFKIESELLAKYYEGNEGLSALKNALNEKGDQDSFAYFLGQSGKKSDPMVEDPVGDDIIFIAERDPRDLPRYLYNRLDQGEKEVYDQIYKAACEHAESTGPLVKSISRERCYELIEMVKHDNPEIFWCSYSFASISVDSTGAVRDVVFNYVMTPQEVKNRKKKIEKSVKPFLKGIKKSMSDYEVALLAHENIVSLIDYDSIGLDIQDNDPYRDKKPDNLRSIYGVFVEEKAVCAGYAVAFQYLLNRMGIECAYVVGYCHDGVKHAWNLIKLEGDYYYVDVTFDDRSNTDEKKNGRPGVSYDYFAITTDELLRSRRIQKPERFPECTATKCNYYVRSRLFFKEYDAEHIKKVIASAMSAGKKELCFKADSAAVIKLISRKLIGERGLLDIMNSVDPSINSISYQSYINEELNILHIYL